MINKDLAAGRPQTKATLALVERQRRREALGCRSASRAHGSRHDSPLTYDAKAAPAPDQPPSTISQVSRQLGLTVRAIRYYEAMGLITCGRGANNSRTLDQGAQARLRAMIELKPMGLTVLEIIELLSTTTTSTKSLRLRLEAQMAALDQQREAIAAYLAHLSSAVRDPPR